VVLVARDDGSVGVPRASALSFIEQHSQWAMLLLFVLLTLESFGLPVPGETALIACSVLASQESLSIVLVIVVGVAAAIIGDDLGHWAARKGGRPRRCPSRRESQTHRRRRATRGSSGFDGRYGRARALRESRPLHVRSEPGGVVGHAATASPEASATAQSPQPGRIRRFRPPSQSVRSGAQGSSKVA
jgi:hypothetical protein